MSGHIVFLVMTFGSFYLFVCWLCRIRLWRAVVAGFIAAAPAYIAGNALHESCHAAGFTMTGVTIEKICLVPNVFGGQFTTAFVRPGPIMYPFQVAVAVPAPYVVDVLILTAVCILARRLSARHDFILSVILLFVCARPIVSLILNANGCLNDTGDFSVIKQVFSPAAAGLAVAILLLAELSLFWTIVRRLRKGRTRKNTTEEQPVVEHPIPRDG